MAYRINLGAWGSVFAVPSCVVDNYIKIASGDHIKVLLYMLKNPGAMLRCEDIAAVAGLSASAVEEAFIFWKNVGVISGENEALTPAETAAAPMYGIPAEQKKSAAVTVKLTSDTQFPPKEIAAAVNSDRGFKYLCETFERLKGAPTTHSERNVLMVITEETGIPASVAVMLVEYCFSVEKATPAYMKSVAKDWYECGIDTITKAEERILQLKNRNTLENRLRSKFRMNSAFSAKQKDFISGWAELCITDELIDEAYEKTLNSTGKLSFPYMDSILKSWSEKGYTTVEQVNSEKSPASKSGTANGTASSFDISTLEQSAYERYRKKS